VSGRTRESEAGGREEGFSGWRLEVARGALGNPLCAMAGAERGARWIPRPCLEKKDKTPYPFVLRAPRSTRLGTEGQNPFLASKLEGSAVPEEKG